jgi:hypothetical protein
MAKESIWACVPLFVVVEFLEIFSNYAKAAPAIHDTVWLSFVSPEQRIFDMVCTYLVYCCIPLVSPFLAVLDMDLERQELKRGQGQLSVNVQPVAQRSSLQPSARQSQRPIGQRQQVPVQPLRPQVPPLQPKQAQPQRGGSLNPPPGVTRPQPQPQPELEAV